MPAEILHDQRMSQCEALVIGEGETRVAALLDAINAAADAPDLAVILQASPEVTAARSPSAAHTIGSTPAKTAAAGS
ncbi:hypothetical protein [Amycolatopsis plumensis]|uniref:Uncharacterized protein n=1 Tax=Amycolatopsis plumensis TaxID=236508 RepID=A0ABV5U402_9PSEU